MTYFFDRVQRNPIIAAVSSLESLDAALDSSCEIIFIQTGNIFNLKELSNRVRSKNKGLYIHIDSIDGFSKDTWGLEYIVKNIHPDGIITEKINLINLCKGMGVFTIQRLFIVDSKSLEYAITSVKKNRPNAIDVLPGIMPTIVKKIITDTNMPVISSGLISNKEDIDSIFNAGAIAISSSNKKIWQI